MGRVIGSAKMIAKNGIQMAGTKSMVMLVGKTAVVARVAVGKMEDKTRKKALTPSYQVIGFARAVTITTTQRTTNADSAAQTDLGSLVETMRRKTEPKKNTAIGKARKAKGKAKE